MYQAAEDFRHGRYMWGALNVGAATAECFYNSVLIEYAFQTVYAAVSGYASEAAFTWRLWRGGEAIESKGGLNLYKWNDVTSTTIKGWKVGDRFLYLPNQGSYKLNWMQNASRLRFEMSIGNPIYDSYRYSNGNLIKTSGFLNAERNLLQSHDWWYNPKIGAWLPPIR